MPIIVILFMLAVLLWGQARLFGRKAFQNFEYRCSFDRPEAFEGDEIELVEEVYNRKWVPLPWFKTEITTSRWLEFAGSQSVVTYNTRFVPSFFLVKSYQKVTRRWKVKCLKRGIFPIESVDSRPLLCLRRAGVPALRPHEEHPLERHRQAGADYDTQHGVHHPPEHHSGAQYAVPPV